MKERKISVLIVLVISLLLSHTGTMEKVQAQVRVATYQELKAVLGEEGSRLVEIQEDLVVVGPITIRGDKKINGNGHCIERSKEKGKVYGGSLFLVQGGCCELRNITISGAGKSNYVIGKVFGRLLEVRRGTLVIGENCILRDNINDRLAVDGGGALRIGAKGSCTMRAGEIRNNQTVSRGAGILVDRGATLTILGGLLEANKVVGVGAVYGFDGRGGAIYSEGRVTIQGGNIRKNRAEAYQEAGIHYGGIGAAIYAETGSFLSICGGRLNHNRSTRNCPIWIQGEVSLDGRPDLECIYVAKNVIIDIRADFEAQNTIWVCPSVYKSGVCIAKGKKVPFALTEGDNYKLVRRKGAYYIEVKKKKQVKKKEPEKETQKREASIQTSFPENEKGTPSIYCKKTKLLFYVGEQVDRQILCYGVHAMDSVEGDLTGEIKVLKPKQGRLPTDREGKGEIIFSVQNRKGVQCRKKIYYQVKKNKPPKVQTAPRYLFAWEVKGFTIQQWKELLWQGCVLTDDCESANDLKYSTTVDLQNDENIKAGKWSIRLRVRDQFGHRYYMKKGERRRYGEGNVVSFSIPVTLVGQAKQEGLNTGYLRYTQSDRGKKAIETWTFTSEDIGQIQRFLDQRQDPFAQETNQKFLQKYAFCKRDEEVEDE